MVSPSLEEGISAGQKRNSSDIDKDNAIGTTNSSDMKKPRIVAGEEMIEGDFDNRPSQSPAKGNLEQMKARISRYLEVISDYF